MSRVAVTGGTGFVGKATLSRLLQAGHDVRALARLPQPAVSGIEWILGTLEDTGPLGELVTGADAVIHIAGAVNAPDRAHFAAVNAHGTAAVTAAMRAAGTRRLVHVSSLAAREPQLSDYGWSKAEAERHIHASGLDWTMVRPPAIYGPSDTELLELFQMAVRGIMLLPPEGRLSIVHVDDLARLLATLAAGDDGSTRDQIYEVDDGRHGGWTHKELAHAFAVAVGRESVLALSMPEPLVKLGARIDRLLRRERARLTPDRAEYFCHPDWVSRSAMHPPKAVWVPAVETRAGLAETARVYRDRGVLAPLKR